MTGRAPLPTISLILGAAGAAATLGAGVALRWGTQPGLDTAGRWDEEGAWHRGPEAARLMDDLWSTARLALGGAALMGVALACTRVGVDHAAVRRTARPRRS